MQPVQPWAIDQVTLHEIYIRVVFFSSRSWKSKRRTDDSWLLGIEFLRQQEIHFQLQSQEHLDWHRIYIIQITGVCVRVISRKKLSWRVKRMNGTVRAKKKKRLKVFDCVSVCLFVHIHAESAHMWRSEYNLGSLPNIYPTITGTTAFGDFPACLHVAIGVAV